MPDTGRSGATSGAARASREVGPSDRRPRWDEGDEQAVDRPDDERSAWKSARAAVAQAGAEVVVPEAPPRPRAEGWIGPLPGDPGLADARAAFERFYRDRYADAVRLALLITGSRETAEEIAQDAFVALHARWGTIDRPAAYLRTTVVNACRSAGRRQGRWDRRRHLVATGDRHDDAPPDLADVLLTLPVRQRAALVLRFWSGLSEAEIAEALDVRPGTVKSLVHRGLAALRKELEP